MHRTTDTEPVNLVKSTVGVSPLAKPDPGFASGDTPTVDITRFTGSPSVVLSNLTENELTGAKNLVVQFTGSGTKPDSYHIIKSIPSANQITIHASSVNIDTDQYAFIVGPAVSATVTGSGTEKTFTCDQAHGLQLVVNLSIKMVRVVKLLPQSERLL